MFSDAKMWKMQSSYYVWKMQSSYYGESDRNLEVRSGKHSGISPLTFRKVKLSKDRDSLPICNNTTSFDKFTISAYKPHNYILEVKESLLIKCDRPVLNKNISCAKLFLFDNNKNFERFYYTVILFN